MKTYPTDKIRNVALVGHTGSGKTTLAEALLFKSGAINRMGRVDDGNTVCDFEPEEQKRHISLSLALAPVEWKGHKINLIDTPGYSDFIGDVAAALRVADLAVFVVSAVDGVQVQTEIIWRIAAEIGIPRLLFVNKLDRERANFGSALADMQARFGAGVAPLELPIGAEAAFVGVADLLTDKAYLYEAGKATEAEIPEDLADLARQVRDSLVEGIVVADDALMERYLEGDMPSAEELEGTLAHGVASGSVFPVVCGSAITGVGLDRLADFLCEIGPSPLDRGGVTVVAGGQDVEVKADSSAQPLAYVFKTIADQFIGHLSLFKVLSGTIKVDDHLVNTRSGTDERLHGIMTLRGKEQQNVGEVVAGDIAAVSKLAATGTGDTLAPKTMPVQIVPVEPPPAVYGIAIKAKTQADDDKLGSGLHRLRDEDPALVVERNEETRQTILMGTGETHVAIAIERLARKFGVKVDTEDVRVAYRETITGRSEVEGKYKKQSGGHGQYGVCSLRISPNERGGGFAFIDSVVGGAIPRQFIPAVQKGVEETMSRGGVFGFPVVDVKVECFDGKYHPVDSSEMSFRMAGSLGFQEGMAKAVPIVLEPISLVTIVVPSDYQGDILGDVNGRRGRVQGSEAIGNREVAIQAMVPTAEVLRYAVDLRSMTGGRGRFSAVHDHYEPLPTHLVDKAKATLNGGH